MVYTSCFGCRRPAEPVSVRNGKPVDPPAQFNHLVPVPRLFQQIQAAINGRFRNLSVRYGAHGVPQSIHTERSERLADDSYGISVTKFRRFAVDPSIRDGSAQQALDAARARWRALGLHSYSFQLYAACPTVCPSPRWWTIVVRNGKPRPRDRHWREWATIPRLFGVIQQAIDEEHESLRVYYDGAGVPTSLVLREIDTRDAEVPLAVRGVRPLGNACASALAAAC